MRAATIWTALALASATILGGCTHDVQIGGRTISPSLKPNPDYDGLQKVPGLEWYELSQGWNSELRRAYWFTPQGSALVPYKWFLNLELAERSCRGRPDKSLNNGGWPMFKDPGHMRSLGYIPAPSDPIWNPDALPVGFTKSTTNDGDFLGPTCAACHSNLMDLNGRKVLVEGAPTLGDLQGLNESLANALCSMDPKLARGNGSKAADTAVAKAAQAQFDKFAQRVLGDDNSPETKETLLSDVRLQTKRIRLRNIFNYGNLKSRYGKGRLDALGAILNEVAATKAEVFKNATTSNAPVSYPFLWGTPQSDVVQWNGAVANQALGFQPLGRNVGEVVGVYGHVNFVPTGEGRDYKRQGPNKDRQLPPALISGKETGQLGGFRSSVYMPNLGAIEHWISMLRSPKWPEGALGDIDKAKAERGKALYLGKNDLGVDCATCHKFVERDQQDENYQSSMIKVSEIGTDAAAANNFLLPEDPSTGKRWKTGRYEGMKSGILFGEKYSKYFNYRGEAMSTSVVGVIVGNLFFDGLIGGFRSNSGSDATKADLGDTTREKLFRYKARPLTGIWATAPYLHNGSIPNLAQLLKINEENPPRSPRFCVGSRKFDPKNVGFVSKIDPAGKCPVDEYGSTLLDTSKFGNSNKGHSTKRHGVELPDKDKWALIEFLKTL